ncbi:MAG: hypothetical protein V1773_13490 [bacterium]
MNNKKLTILVTDSGLGGLNVAAKIRANLDNGLFANEINVIYFNALPEKGRGYNSINNLAEKVKIFNSALNGMVKNCNPDIILIACNTLSVVYQHTEFYKNPKVEVMGIVDLGVRMILNFLDNKDTQIVLFGTPTTIQGEAHKNLLINQGINPNNIIPQACKNLESEIQIDAASSMVKELIEKYLTEAVPLQSDNKNYIFALCCTHYEYSLPLFEACIKEKIKNYKIVNPNNLMVEELNKRLTSNSVTKQIVTQKVLSRTVISQVDIDNISGLIAPISGKFALALQNYECNEKLFEI